MMLANEKKREMFYYKNLRNRRGSIHKLLVFFCYFLFLFFFSCGVYLCHVVETFIYSASLSSS